MGHELDDLTWDRLYHENRNSILRTVFGLLKLNGTYLTELYEHNAQLRNHGPLKYVESMCDEYQINW